MNTEFYDPFQIDHLRERIAKLEQIWILHEHELEERIAALEKHFQEEILLLSASTSRTELHKRIAALEEIIGQTVAAHDRIDSLARDCFIYDGRISSLKERIATLETQFSEFNELPDMQHEINKSTAERIAALEDKVHLRRGC